MKVVMSGNGNGTKVRWDELLRVLTTTQRKAAVCMECGTTKSVKYIRNGYTSVTDALYLKFLRRKLINGLYGT